VATVREGDLELLQEIARFEDSHDMEQEFRIGWCWRHVRIWPGTLSRLFKEGYLENVFRSNSYTGYRLSELGRALVFEARAAEQPEPCEAHNNEEAELPDDLFRDIIGHEEVKELLRAALQAEKPVHVLLAGPPALAKTLFLWDIERAYRERAIWLVGSATSKAGLWDVVAERQPWVLLIDELDKMNAADTAALLSMMEGGRLVRAKRGRNLSMEQPVRVFAACNRLQALSPELKSRFAIRTLSPYSRSDFLTVVKAVLLRREEITQGMAEEIARRLDGKSQDVRDAIRVARLARQLGVERAIALLGLGEGELPKLSPSGEGVTPWWA
jgi:Holliday junction DNA helicase RuvB